MTNTSATGGYLVPSNSEPLEDDALTDFLQALVVGVTGMAGSLMRPRWQAEPPNLPSFGTTWGAVGVVATRPDVNGVELHDPNGDGSDVVIFHEEIDFMVSLYGPLNETMANRIRSGLQTAQNREPLTLAAMGLVRISGNTKTSELIKERWLPRTDLTVTLRREIRRVYPVLNLESASGTLVTAASTETFNA